MFGFTIRIQTWDDVLKETPLFDLKTVASNQTPEQVAEFAKSNNLRWVNVPGQLYGGYYRNQEGTCWLLT